MDFAGSVLIYLVTTLDSGPTLSQQSFHGVVDGVEYLTTYSWSRYGPTLAILLQWLLALGDWTDRAGQSTAHGYAASKYTLSLRAKHAILSGARDLHIISPGKRSLLKPCRSAQLWQRMS